MLGYLLRTSQIKRAVRAERRHHGSQHGAHACADVDSGGGHGRLGYPLVRGDLNRRPLWAVRSATCGFPTRRSQARRVPFDSDRARPSRRQRARAREGEELLSAIRPARTARYSRHRTGLQHLAFMVTTRAAVARVHRFVQRVGGEVSHEPLSFPRYPPPYFATFWLDPFGVMLEAVCHYDRD